MKRSPFLALALGGVIAAVAYAGPLAEAVRGSTADRRSTVLEIVYAGPVNKPFPSVALSGGADAYDAHLAFEKEFPLDFPAVGERTAFDIGPEELGRALKSVSDFRSVGRDDAVVGLFVIELSTKRSARLLLDGAEGRRAFAALEASLTDAGAKRDLLQLKSLIFPH